MTREELLTQLEELAVWDDREAAGSRILDLLLAYIADEDIAKAVNDQEIWFA